MSGCSGISKSRTQYFTCLSKNDLIEICKSVGIFLDFKINTKEELYKILKTFLVENERKWWSYDFIPKNLRLKLKYILFKPLNSKKEWGWLSTDDISSILYQKALKFNKKGFNFHYHGAFPADFFKLNPEEIPKITKINKKMNVGIVLNTDPSNKKGKHWVAIFIDKKNIFYFDPVKNKPNKFIKDFIDNIKGDRCLHINNIQYQKKDGTCGLYVIEFLLLKAQNKELIMSDDFHINKKRTQYFV